MAENNEKNLQGEYISATSVMRSAGYSSTGNTENFLDYGSSIVPPYTGGGNTTSTTEENGSSSGAQTPVTPPHIGGGNTTSTTEENGSSSGVQQPVIPPSTEIGGSTTETYDPPIETDKPIINTTEMKKLLFVPYVKNERNFAGEVACAVKLLHNIGNNIVLKTFTSMYLKVDETSSDPDQYFCGNPEHDDGRCNAPVIVEAMNTSLGKAHFYKQAVHISGKTMNYIRSNYLDKNIPVMIWATKFMDAPIDSDIPGLKENQYCYIVLGYDETYYYLYDPRYSCIDSYSHIFVQEIFSGVGSQAVAIIDSNKIPEITTPETDYAPSKAPQTLPKEAIIGNVIPESKYADPVDVATGSHLLKNHLLNLFGGQKLTVTAHYNSSNLRTGVLGVGWYHNFEKRIEVFGTEAFVYENPSEFSKYLACDLCSDYHPETKGKEGYLLSNTADGYCLDCNGERYEHYNLNGQLVKVVDRHGFEITLTYTDACISITDMVTGKSIYLEKDSTGNVVRVYDDTGRETVLTYQNNYLVQIKDVANCMLTYSYDENGRVKTGTDRDDVCYFSNIYDELGRVSLQLDGNNTTEILSTFTYGENGEHISTNRLGEQSVRTFNEDGLLIRYEDENGNVTTYTYDDAYNVSSVTDPLDKSTNIVYNKYKKPVQVKDKNGNVTDYQYDDAGNLLKITYPNGAEETFVYNARNQVVQHTDLRNTVTVYTYDGHGLLSGKKVGSRNAIAYRYENGLLMSETDAMGNTTEYAYDAAGQMVSKTDASGLVTSYEHDKAGNLLKVTDPNNNSVSYTYDSNYQKTATVDAKGNKTWYSYTENMKPSIVQLPDGQVIHYTYDAEDRLIAETDQAGNVTRTQYDAGGRVISKTYADGGVETFEYDAVGRVVKHTNPKGAITQTTYDANGNTLSVTDAEGNETRNQYDAMSRVVRTVNPVAGAVVYEYSAAGDLLSETDALGHKKTYTYDEFGNRLSATDAKGNTTRYTYDANNNLLTETDALGQVTVYTYDKQNRVVSVRNPKNATVTYGYDAAGRQTTVTDAKGNTFTKVYDPNGNVLKVLDAKGKIVTETAYNELNLPSSVTDAAGKKTTFTYNALGKVETTVDALGNTQHYGYNTRGQNSKVTDASGNDSTATYDLLGNVTCLAGPLGGATNYAYDDLGRLISESTVSGGQIQYTYNALNLKAELTNARGQIRKFFYDALGRITGYLAAENEVCYTYDENGNILTVSDRNGTISRTYDALNRVTSYTDTFGNVIQYRYDAVGNLEYLIYPDGSEVYYCYDVNNNLVSVSDWAGRVTTYTYDQNNRVIGVTKPDGSTTATVYDDKQRIVSTVEKTANDVIISGFEYEYDAIGRIAGETDLAKNIKLCYTYDEQSRVTKRTVISLSGTTETEEVFSYDGAGNITEDNSYNFVYDTNNRLTEYKGNSVTYDLDGNMLSNGTLSCSYDSGNRLISAGGHSYTYNAENVRIRNLCADADTTYTYNTNCKLSQLLIKTTNGIVTKYVYGLGLIGEEKCGEFKTYHFDYRGSTVAITDANGTITDTFAYDTYGKLISKTGSSFVIFGYNGRDGVVTDKNGLIYMRARYYSPELRRFVNADIVAGSLDNSITLNRFVYANGNPVSFIDPFGLCADERGASEDSNSTLNFLEEGHAEAVETLENFQKAIRKQLSYTGDLVVTIYLPRNTELYYKVSTTVGNGPIDVSGVAGSLFDIATTISFENREISTTYGFEGSISIKASAKLDECTSFYAQTKMDMNSIEAVYGTTLNCGESGSVSIEVGMKQNFSQPRLSPVRAQVKGYNFSYVLQDNTVPSSPIKDGSTEYPSKKERRPVSWYSPTPDVATMVDPLLIGTGLVMGFSTLLVHRRKFVF